MKSLTIEQANLYLSQVGMEIGSWNQIVETDSTRRDNGKWKNFQVPSNAHELYNFADHVAGWLLRGRWKIFQIDDSSYLDTAQTALFNKLLFGSEEPLNLIENRSFYFEFGNDNEENEKTELLIANLIFVFLLFECHGYVVSSNRNAGQYLAIQDGFVYFYSDEEDLSGAELLLNNFQKNPLSTPEWIMKINAELS